MTHCEEAVTDIGGYSRALATYSGLKVGSIVVRGGRLVGRGTRESAEAIANAGKLVLASVEYSGLVSASLVKRGGSATGACVSKLFKPIASVAKAPFSAVNRMAGKMFKASDTNDEALKSIEHRLMSLEDRMEKLEREGVRMPLVSAPTLQPAREVGEDKKFVLRALVDANLALREQS
jgi:hypothetical protein